MNEVIVLDQLTKKFGERVVVDHLSFTVQKGKVFGLLGHNGAGKSTTIDCILGLKQSNEGTAKVWGKEVSLHRKELFQKIGVQLQNSTYQNNIRVHEICEEMSALYNNPANYHELLKQFQLETFEKQAVEQLSGGERQKLSVVIALLGNPELIFLDELTTGLDVAARREVWQILRKLKQQGMTLFLTTHYMEEAENLCDEIVILKQGKKVIQGTVSKIIEDSPYNTLEEAYLWYTGEDQLV